MGVLCGTVNLLIRYSSKRKTVKKAEIPVKQERALALKQITQRHWYSEYEHQMPADL